MTPHFKTGVEDCCLRPVLRQSELSNRIQAINTCTFKNLNFRHKCFLLIIYVSY
jgi:hypothetical protein